MLRGHAALAAPSGDVDLLIERGCAGAVARVAASTAGVVHLRTWGGQCFLLAADATSGWSVIVHAVEALSFGPFGAFALDADVLGRRVRDGVWRADDGDELWVTLLHALLDKGRVATKHRARLQSLAVRAPALDREFATIVDDAAGVIAAVASGRWDDVDGLARPLRDAWWRTDRVAASWRYVRNRSWLVARKVAETWTRPGAIVAVLAPDGAGKSTLVAALASNALGLPVRRFYAGAYGAGLSERLPAVPGLRLLARLVLLTTIGIRARWHRRRRRVALLDRHPMEIALAGRGGLRRTVLSRTVPKPDLVLVLDAPGEVLHARSGEHDAATLDEMRGRYTNAPGAVVLDATRPVDDVAAAARAAIWACVTARWQR